MPTPQWINDQMPNPKYQIPNQSLNAQYPQWLNDQMPNPKHQIPNTLTKKKKKKCCFHFEQLIKES